MTATVFAAALLVCAPLQVGRLWTFDDLVRESDLVVIGKALRTRDTGRTANHPELRPDLPVVELESDIQVLATLKSPAQTKPAEMRNVVLRHFRRDMAEWKRRHPPTPGLPPPGIMNAGEELTLKPGETYLFFLKRGQSGWEPATGYTFPNQSAFPLGGAGRISG